MFDLLIPPSTGPIELSADEVAAAPRRRHDGRPWVGLCMVAGLDGGVAVDERSAALSSEADTALYGALRRAADMVIVGAGTARDEGYGAPRRPGQRLGVVTSTGDVDTAGTLFTSGAGFLLMPEDGPRAPSTGGRPIDVIRAGRGRVDLALALTRLGTVAPEPTFVQVEGGPRLNGALVEARCLDELNLTISPRMTGGEGSRIIVGASEGVRDMRLTQLARAGSFLFGRWVRTELA
ncbi:MAG: dihydrofolate reductase family protein [Desertimonas sp.]